jgi:hypothetical protein
LKATNIYTVYLNLKNEGSTGIARGVKAKITTSDPRVTKITNYNPTFDDLAPGQTGTSSSFIVLFTNSTLDSLVSFDIEIESNGFVYWNSKNDLVTGIHERIDHVPLMYSLEQNFPNPFNPITMITFSLPTPERVKIEILNSLGQEVKTLFDKQMSIGVHEIVFDASDLPSGLFIYRMTAGDFRTQKKCLFLK